MPDLLLDTNILVDIFRGNAAAVAWIKTQSDSNLGISGFTLFEMLQGARNKNEMLHLKNALEQFQIFWPSDRDFKKSVNIFVSLFLSHNIEIFDVLIAQTAIGLDVPLVTLNKKHFEPISGLNIIKPY